MLFFEKEISQNGKNCHKKKSLAKERDIWIHVHNNINNYWDTKGQKGRELCLLVMTKCGIEGSKRLEKLGIAKWIKEPWVVRQKNY